MTCEVAVANKLAIALAADSAVTFSGEGVQSTYASGANKIFQLALAEPVAVMIYNNAAIAGVPWELILKAYRSQLGGKGFTRLKDYQDDIVRFLTTCSEGLIPSKRKLESTIDIYIMGLRYVVGEIITAQGGLLEQGTPEERLVTLWQSGLDQFFHTLSIVPYANGYTEQDVRVAIDGGHDDALVNLIPHVFNIEDLRRAMPFVNQKQLALAAIEAAFRYGPRLMERTFTGVVVAGFGQDDYLPGYIDIKFYGYLGDKILYSLNSEKSVDHNGTGSVIQAFARQAMVETFTQGASPEVWTAVRQAYDVFAAKVCADAANASGVLIDQAALERSLETNRAGFMQKWAHSVFDGHLKPLYRVVTGLSVEELAELAETLVLLESLKEKVTHRTQSVGGPIDVAVITKAEGLVWIKRKLYFEPHLNHRFFQRMERST